ncbi:MAG: tRNA pseudouridine(54/55) synthase Pus10 [Candidatus Methanomethylophilaceae archaeon]|jgi:tRNA pseudouridine synthase 10|nr:tRNA pseudouridine(54/55) synthase Pus10 [Candidatus Methanomethylophilaceae archaeon]
MEQWISENIEKMEAVAHEGICDRCLGRMFGKLSTGMTNDIRGSMIRDALRENGVDIPSPDECPLCDDVFESLDIFAEAVAEKVVDVESDNFLVGCKVDPAMLKMEKEIVERHGLDKFESIKTELNREIGKVALPMIHRPVEFKNPQCVACVDVRFADVTLDLSPIFIKGRYTKLSREIPQTIWPCRMCHGKGCPRCNGTGKMYQTSVQEIIGDIALEMCQGKEHFFHGMGREDIDALCLGEGRPFVLEISQPKRRDIDLDELEMVANQSELAHYHRLQFTERAEVQRTKTATPSKTYRVTVKADSKVNKERVVEVALSFKNVHLNQRTPKRVEHRRADLVRDREILWVEAEVTGEDTFDLTLETESGTYVKEFVSGDNGRCTPSFSEALGIQCYVQTLDVIAINNEGMK